MSKDNNEPLYSTSWDHPCLVDNQDGAKTEWYERDLSKDALEVVGEIISNISKQQKMMPQFEQAKSIVDLVITLQGNQGLLLEKLYTLNSGKKILDAKAEAKITPIAKLKSENQESII